MGYCCFLLKIIDRTDGILLFSTQRYRTDRILLFSTQDNIDRTDEILLFSTQR